MKDSHFDYSDQVLQETIKLQQRQIDLLKLQVEAQSEQIKAAFTALESINKFDFCVVDSLKMTDENVYSLTHTVHDLIKQIEYLQNKSYGDRSI